LDDSPEQKPLHPFCSERCRLADLGSWLDASYRIPVDDDDLDEGLPNDGHAGPPKDPVN
jgi:endogenous inhibitor of DNA gyrase (YacG/DUF329 family)